MMKTGRLHTTDRRMTLKQWGELPEDVYAELVNGVLVEDEMTSAIHDTLMSHLIGFFLNWVRPRGGFVFPERKYGVARYTGRKPDVSVFLSGARNVGGKASVTMAPPDIAIEVITPTPRDTRRDRVEKRREYARFGVRWYWIIDPASRTLEILGLARNGRYEHIADATDGKLKVPGCRGLVLDVDELWREADRAERRLRLVT